MSDVVQAKDVQPKTNGPVGPPATEAPAEAREQKNDEAPGDGEKAPDQAHADAKKPADHEVFAYHPPEKKSILLPVALIGVLAASAVGYVTLSHGRKHAVESEATERKDVLDKGPKVEVGKVHPTDPVRVVTLSGEVHAYRQATLYAKVSGYLKSIRVDKGDRVKENEVLGIIESPEVEHEVASKKADLAIKRITDARFTNLAKSGVVSQQEMDTAKAQVDIAQEDLKQVEALRGYDVIRAPFNGIVTARYADNGALLQAATGAATGALPLVDIADSSKVRVYVYLGQNDALFVKDGDSSVVWNEARPDKKAQASVTRITQSLDTRTRTMLTEIVVPNDANDFYPGSFVKVRLNISVPPSLTMPADAVVFRAGKSNVAVVRDGKAQFVEVTADAPDGTNVRVSGGGVRDGETVVLHPGDDVVDGAAVQPVEKKPVPGASAAPSGSAAPPNR